MTRVNVPSGSPLEATIGFSRAVRKGPFVSIAGTAPIPQDGGEVPQDVYAQTQLCFEIASDALGQAGASLSDTVRTRIFLTDISSWTDAARAHGELFADVRPVCTFMEVSRFIDPDWRVEIELDAILGTEE